ncbi:MAG: hypothetical protein M1818_005232 [Claussenomyces sp. TS43310]|nr:MAG: hypothetical protein M1818_005232 [Claussenomyces sp. TS43310]
MDKVTYFSQLYSLAQPSDEDDEDGCDTRAAATSSPDKTKKSPVSPVFPAATPSPMPDDAARASAKASSLRRTESAPTHASECQSRIEATPIILGNTERPMTSYTPGKSTLSIVAETPLAQRILQHRRGPQRRTLSDPVSSTTLAAQPRFKAESLLGKRKRKESTIKLVPEARQIFKGLKFFYIPNDDVNPVRRVRITKAREYGVDWTRDWHEATHIIAGKKLKFQDITGFLRISSVPDHVTLVNETYPIECIQYKAVLNASQDRYRVEGQVQVLPVGVQIPSSQTSDRSLQLKSAQSKPGRWDYVPPKTTPPRSEDPTQKLQTSDISGRASDASSPGVWLDTQGILEQVTSGQEDINQARQAAYLDSKNPSRTVPRGDEFDTMIDETRRLKHLPLDDDDQDDHLFSPGTSNEFEGSEEESDSYTFSKSTKKEKRRRFEGEVDPESFSCARGGTGDASSSNPNARTIEILQEMADYYTRMNDSWRSIAYRKVITRLHSQSKKITTAEEAFSLPSIGKRLAAKIEEIVVTDRLQRLENAKAKPGDRILQMFMDIYGVGFSQAWKWMQQGYATLDDLKRNASLHRNQRVGIEHYDDLLKRIPRAEVEALGEIVRTAADRIDEEVEVIIGGSYRRGSRDSGDIDIILTRPGTSCSNDLLPFLHALTKTLTSIGFLVEALSVPKAQSGSKWHGCCVLPGQTPPVWRRIDFLLVPASELGAALIYFTGNDIFNRSLRLWASKKGMLLNERGLYKDVARGPGRVKLNGGTLVEGADERKIFKTLGIKWRPPEQRIC